MSDISICPTCSKLLDVDAEKYSANGCTCSETKAQENWPWNEFPDKASTWRVCVEKYERLQKRVKALEVENEKLRWRTAGAQVDPTPEAYAQLQERLKDAERERDFARQMESVAIGHRTAVVIIKNCERVAVEQDLAQLRERALRLVEVMKLVEPWLPRLSGCIGDMSDLRLRNIVSESLAAWEAGEEK